MSNKHHIEGFMSIGCHTLVVHRQVTVDGKLVGLNAVEVYRITPQAEGTYHDVNALLEDPMTDDATIVYEGHDWNIAREQFAKTVIAEATNELATV